MMPQYNNEQPAEGARSIMGAAANATREPRLQAINSNLDRLLARLIEQNSIMRDLHARLLGAMPPQQGQIERDSNAKSATPTSITASLDMTLSRCHAMLSDTQGVMSLLSNEI